MSTPLHLLPLFLSHQVLFVSLLQCVASLGNVSLSDAYTISMSLTFGSFSYCNFLIERDRRFVLDTLVNGLSRLEYRGYDSAGSIVIHLCNFI